MRVRQDNVRLNKACDHAVLTDWGYARRPGERTETYMCGTPAYASPEQLTGYSPDSITGRRKLCAATDVWSLGVTLFEMVAGDLPFGAEDHQDLVRNVLQTKYKMPEFVPPAVRELIVSMLALCPGDRATIDELCASPHLEEMGVLVPVDPAFPKVRRSDGACAEDENAPEWLKCTGLHRPAVRRVLWCLLYGSLCAGALWSAAGSVGESRYELHES